MLGFLLNIWLKIEFVGYSLVEALIFFFAFNYLAPFVNENLLTLPVTHLSYWICLSLFIMIHFIGEFISKLSPKLVTIKTEQTKSEKN